MGLEAKVTMVASMEFNKHTVGKKANIELGRNLGLDFRHNHSGF